MALTKRVANRMVREAEAAATRAANAAEPTPMMVYEADGLTNKPKPDARAWYVSEGVCGFAWVEVHPANSRVANAIREYGDFRAGKGYPSGLHVWIHLGGQSHARKVAAAHAYASVIESYVREYGEAARIYTGDRLD